MKALILTRYGGPGALEFVDVPVPQPGPLQLLVQIHAAGINPVDNGIAQGKFKPMLKIALPATMGSDLAGVVVGVGNQVTRFKIGDAVFASTFDSGFGALAEFAVVPEGAAALKPANLSFVEAASIPMVGLTSWQALVERMALRSGQKVFIPAGSGGIGTFAIQLAKHLGAIVGSTTSTGNVAFVRGLGADEVIDYKKQAFEAELRGYDAVLGTVPGHELEKTLHIVKPGSQVVSLVGPPDIQFAKRRGMNFLMGFVFGLLSRKIIGLANKRSVSYAFMFVRPDGGQLATIGSLLESSVIRPVVDKVFPFDETKVGLAYLAQGRARGKVVIQISVN